MTVKPAPKVSHPTAFPIIWLLPILALAVCVWLGIRELTARGPEVTVEFTDGTGVEAGKTTLEYNGVEAGMVKDVELLPDLKGVVITIALKKIAKPLTSAGTLYWIVHPEIGAGGVHGLDTLVSGVRLTARPGNGPETKRFRGLDETPPPAISDRGRTFILKSDQLGSLSTGSPVMYRQLKVGQVEASRLSEDSTAVLIRIHLEEPYVDLVRTTTKFWNAGGFSFKLSLLGAEVKDSSLESLISGGVAFATPDQEPLGPPAEANAQFDLASAAEKDWLKWKPKIPVKAEESSPQAADKGTLLQKVIK
jgi:paraquat-inducible protein B